MVQLMDFSTVYVPGYYNPSTVSLQYMVRVVKLWKTVAIFLAVIRALPLHHCSNRCCIVDRRSTVLLFMIAIMLPPSHLITLIARKTT